MRTAPAAIRKPGNTNIPANRFMAGYTAKADLNCMLSERDLGRNIRSRR
jgi:hypothetical protein